MAHSKLGTFQWKAPRFKPGGSEGQSCTYSLRLGAFRTIMLIPQW